MAAADARAAAAAERAVSEQRAREESASREARERTRVQANEAQLIIHVQRLQAALALN